MTDDAADKGWQALLRPGLIAPLAVLLGGVLMHSMNVLLVATILPSIVREVGGAALMSWPTTAYLASSIVAAACTGLTTTAFGAGRAFCGGALVFGAGTLVCAFAPSMTEVILGRLVQGFGGGLLSALAYVLVRSAFPAAFWPRVFALLAGVWSVSVLVGPLLGGLFARYGDWRGAFFSVAALALLLAVLALKALPTGRPERNGPPARLPTARIGLICLAIATMSLASIMQTPLAKAVPIALAVGALALALRLDRKAKQPLLPSDAFSLASRTGVALWIALLVSIAFNPLPIFGPAFLQKLHGLDPLAAGYASACASMAWTAAAVLVAGLGGAWPGRLIVAGPFAMAAGLLGVAWLMPTGPLPALLLFIVLFGAGIGVCWSFTAQSIMHGARTGEETIAASAVATVQQAGLALGAALAGLVANATGFALGRDMTGITEAAFWVPASFTAAAVVAGTLGLRLIILHRAPA